MGMFHPCVAGPQTSIANFSFAVALCHALVVKQTELPNKNMFHEVV